MLIFIECLIELYDINLNKHDNSLSYMFILLNRKMTYTKKKKKKKKKKRSFSIFKQRKLYEKKFQI